MHAPRKTELARQMIAQGQRLSPPGLRALLIVVDGKRDQAELTRLGQGLGLGERGLSSLVAQGLVEIPPPPVDTRAVVARAKKLVSAKFFALDLVTRMLAGREAELRLRAREADTESRFIEWVELCCERIEAHSDAERAAMFRSRVDEAFAGGVT